MIIKIINLEENNSLDFEINNENFNILCSSNIEEITFSFDNKDTKEFFIGKKLFKQINTKLEKEFYFKNNKLVVIINNENLLEIEGYLIMYSYHFNNELKMEEIKMSFEKRESVL